LRRSRSESRMREIRTSGLMSGEGKRGHWLCLNATAPFLDSTDGRKKSPCSPAQGIFPEQTKIIELFGPNRPKF
jgi:hypothetical protein